ncbi:GntR family transcriptional regulator [Paenibacillus sp. GP183]|uniref:GntR family transcriptional regulator n=1 Tax=Paenibacillus sp. GP183 TaxID=1882751 RepID=UPI0008981282|nr:GntR family transcriptional regulator [Paenibacillus sp. GP183]SEC00803.1 transcriptional regulator, GntR family [Paenibacillus sp. GP183]
MEKVNFLLAKDRIAAILREEILSGSLKPGKKLLEKELSEKLGVSRTPLREAIRNLEVEGLIESIPQKGSRVKILTRKDVINVFELRIHLESLATATSVPHLTEIELSQLHDIQTRIREATEQSDWREVDLLNKEFHSMLMSGGDNDRLFAMIDQLHQVGSLIRLSTLSIPGRSYKAIEEHDEILKAALAKNAELASNLIQKHLEIARNTLLSHIGQTELSENLILL